MVVGIVDGIVDDAGVVALVVAVEETVEFLHLKCYNFHCFFLVFDLMLSWLLLVSFSAFF